jgi:hypothetical protein
VTGIAAAIKTSSKSCQRKRLVGNKSLAEENSSIAMRFISYQT